MSEQQRIYLDNAATSFPKPEVVYQAIDDYQRNIGAPVGRGAYSEAIQVQSSVQRCRQRAADLLGAENLNCIQFTCNGTDSLNIALHGLLQRGDHVITTELEHNSVIRPLRELERRAGVDLTIVPVNSTGCIDPTDIQAAIRPETKLIAIIHASNVTGIIQPIEQVADIAKSAQVLCLLDAAQSAGHLPINLQQLPVDLLACPGHKGLLGPLGTGLLYVRSGVEEQLQSLRQGGTGSVSEEEFQPDSLPDKYESGNHNAPGLIGLEAALEWIAQKGLSAIRRHEIERTTELIAGLQQIPGVKLHGETAVEKRLGVVSITVPGFDPQVLASILDDSFRIQTRAGLHCAPGVHRCLGTLTEGGTVRFSIGAFTTSNDIEHTLSALTDILKMV